MKTFNLISGALFLLFCILSIKGYSQEKTDTVSVLKINNEKFPIPDKNNRKNSLMLNITNPVLLSVQFQTIAYERILKNNQSFTVAFGKFSLPKFGEDLADSLGMNTDYKDKGLHISGDYRFYLKKENKYAAPRGFYIAPFYTYNYLNRENYWYIDESLIENVTTNLKFSIHTVGVELGYQFVFWDRMAVDMIMMGPGIGFYNIKAKMGTSMDPANEAEFFQKLNDLLADRIPGYDKVIEPGTFSRNGSYNTVDVGFRYVVRIGYRF
jgi:hypothetical protein